MPAEEREVDLCSIWRKAHHGRASKPCDMPQGEWRARRDDGREVALTITHQLAEWQCRSAFVGMWFRVLTDRLGPEDEARVVIDYDDKAGLLSFDAWVGDERVYGADDFVG